MISTRSLAVTTLMALSTGTVAQGQMAGIPVLQNAFANPGITVGLNYGRADNITGYAAAAAWAPGSARFVVSGGFGSAKPDDGDASATYGGRVAVPIFRFMGDAAGIGAFGGVGSWSDDQSVALLGMSIGYRRPLGGLGVSVHAAPSYQRFSATLDDESVTGSAIRFSGGVDISYGDRFGATIGFEAGGKAKTDKPGPSGSIFGLGVSYALRRVR